MPKVTQQIGIRHGNINPLLSNAPGCLQKSKIPYGLRAGEQELQRLKPEALPFCPGAVEAEGNSEEVPGLGINMEVGKSNLEVSGFHHSPPPPVDCAKLKLPFSLQSQRELTGFLPVPWPPRSLFIQVCTHM